MAAACMNAFRGALERCGLSEPARVAVTDPALGGITNMRDMARLGKDGVKRLCKVLRDGEIPVSIMAEQTLEVMRYWARERVNLGLDVLPADFTHEAIDAAALKFTITQHIIKSLILEGPAWSYITPTVDRAENGRAAWSLLRDHYGNETFMNRDIEEASNAIDHLHYKKEYANFTFEDYITQLTKHYNTLE